MNKIIENSLKYTLAHNIWSVLLTSLGVGSAICTILGISLRNTSPIWISIVSFIVVLAVSCIFFYRVLNRLDRYITVKEEKITRQNECISGLQTKLNSYKDYFSFMSNLSDSFSAINRMARDAKLNEGLFQREMLKFCNKLRESFEVLNPYDVEKKSTYSVSIKVALTETDVTPNVKTKEIEVMNSFRDSSSFQDESRNEEVYSQTHHYIADNTAYQIIFDQILDRVKYIYYINNDIENDKNYKSSSSLSYIKYKIPYRSEFVMPLLSINPPPLSKRFLGFLCITCNQPNGFTFDEKEIRLMLTIADNLFNIISKWQKNQITGDTQAEQDPQIVNDAELQIASKSQEKLEQ